MVKRLLYKTFVVLNILLANKGIQNNALEYGNNFKIDPSVRVYQNIGIRENVETARDYNLRNAFPQTMVSTDSIINYNGEKIKDGFVYYDGNIYAIEAGVPVSSTLYSRAKRRRIDKNGEEQVYRDEEHTVYVNQSGVVEKLSGVNKLNEDYYYFDTYNHTVYAHRFSNLKYGVCFDSNNNIRFSTWLWADKNHNSKVLSDSNGFYYEQGFVSSDDKCVYIDSERRLRENALYKYEGEKFLVENFLVTKRNLTDDEVKEIEETKDLQLIDDEESEKEKNKNHWCESVYGDDKKYHIYDENGNIVNGKIYKLYDSSLISTNLLADEKGNVVEKEGLYAINRYDSNHKLINDNVRYCYIDKNSKVVSNDFIFYNNKVYYAYASGFLAKNTFLAGRYYFDDNCELVYGEINEENVEEARNWLFYCSLSDSDEKFSLLDKDGKKIDIMDAAEDNLEIYHDIKSLPSKYLANNEKELKNKGYDVTEFKNGKKGIRLIDKFVPSKNDYYNGKYGSGIYYIDKDGIIIKDDIIKIGDTKYVLSESGALIIDDLLNFSKASEYLGDNVKSKLKDKIAYIDNDGVLIDDKCIINKYVEYGRKEKYDDNRLWVIFVLNAEKKYKNTPLVERIK